MDNKRNYYLKFAGLINEVYDKIELNKVIDIIIDNCNKVGDIFDKEILSKWLNSLIKNKMVNVNIICCGKENRNEKCYMSIMSV